MRIEVVLISWALVIFLTLMKVGKLVYGKAQRTSLVLPIIFALISIPVLYVTFKNTYFKYCPITAQFDFDKRHWKNSPTLRYQYIDDLRANVLIGLHANQVDSILFQGGWTREKTWIGKNSPYGEMGVLNIEYLQDTVINTSIMWE